jgi:integrase
MARSKSTQGITQVRAESGETRWEVRVTVGEKRVKCRCKTLAEAKQRRVELLRQQKDFKAKRRMQAHATQMGWPQRRGGTLGEIIKSVITSDQFLQRSKSSTSHDRVAYCQLVEHFGENMPLQHISAAALLELRKRMAEPHKATPYRRQARDKKTGVVSTEIIQPKKPGRTRSNIAINALFRSISALFNRARKEGLISDNPCANIALLPAKTVAERILTSEEERRMLAGIWESVNVVYRRRRFGKIETVSGRVDCVPPQHREDMEEWIVFCLDTGARTVSEVGSVTWGDFCAPNRIVIQTKKRNGRGRRDQDCMRGLCLTRRLRGLLERRFRRLHPSAKTPDLNSRGGLRPLFDHADEPIFGPDLERGKRFKRLCERLGIKGACAYTMRHTCATRAVQSGVPLTHVQYQLGHTDYRMTLRYAKFSPEMSDSVARALEDWGSDNGDKAIPGS